MRTNAVIITRYFQTAIDFNEWYWHHRNLGIDQIRVYDAGVPFDLRAECAKYQLEYTYVKSPIQYKIYTDYIKTTDADFVLPLDDDEYLWIAPEFKTLENVIAYYESLYGQFNSLGIRWLYKFPKIFNSERTCPVLEYCTEQNDYLATRFSGHGNNVIKCLVRSKTFDRYMDAAESMVRNHVPVTKPDTGALLCNGTYSRCQVVKPMTDEKIRLIHCPYKGYSEYMIKRDTSYSISSNTPHKRKRAFDSLLERLA